uniref:Neural cell adhesion molecule L1 n=1 Tax=Electrophorus electricus TaxID=8005 RepID=A0AAY5F5D4_ELEEL
MGWINVLSVSLALFLCFCHVMSFSLSPSQFHFFFSVAVSYFLPVSAVKKPPVITAQPVSITAFSSDDIIMTCEATGNPPPTFRWMKDGVQFDPSAVSMSPDSGSFVAKDGPIHQLHGNYSCYASNVLGTAVSSEVRIVTEGASKEKKEKKMVEEGSPVVLHCNPPQSSVTPVIHWMDRRLRHIQQSERVIQGRDGNLYFSHVIPEDSRSDYTCNVQFLGARIIVVKEAISLNVVASNAVVRNRRPQMMRPTGSHSSYLVLRGQSLDLECIVQGVPTPSVQWVRKDDALSESRTSKDSFDRLLHFTSISENDDGEYQCSATNSQGTSTHTYSVTVEAAPYWTKEPDSELYAPGETVRLECQADGIPAPLVTWCINGIPLSDIDPDPRRTVTGGVLIMKDVTRSDTAVYQCKAANIHGNILVNTYVLVIGEIYICSDIFYIYIKLYIKFCNTQGFQRNTYVIRLHHRRWYETNQCFLCDGLLQIMYYCNFDLWKKTFSPSHGQLSLYHVCMQSVVYILTCPSCPALLLASWHANSHVCSCSHSDKPDAPSQLQISEARERSVILSWTPGDDHKSPVFEYVVEFDTGADTEQWEELARVSGDTLRASLSLRPFFSYRFRVIAINAVGKSDPSLLSEAYPTPADRPDSNPVGVQSESEDPDNLVITWKVSSMDRMSFNGPGFRYKVMWRKVVGSGPSWHFAFTTSPRYVVTDVDHFTAFDIKVQAVNNVGEGPEPRSTIGYSGEDYPLESPLNVGVILLSSTAIRVTWAPVERKSVRGHLLGYKVLNHSDEEKKDLGGLLPYSCYSLTVKVFNSRGAGPDSEARTFQTPEGVPGPPTSLVLVSPSEREMALHWTTPAQPNGVLMGYLVQYQQLDNAYSPMQEERIDDPTVTQLTLKELDPHSRYRFYLRGFTAAGDGLPITREGATILDGGWFIGLISALVLLLLVLLILCFIKRSKGGKYSVKDKEEGQVDSEARPMKDETFGEYRCGALSYLSVSDNEDKCTASLPSLCEDSKLCSDGALEDYGNSNSIQTEVIMDESLASQLSSTREAPEVEP